MSMHARLSNPAKWPCSVRRAVDAIAGVIAFACQLGRKRAASRGGIAAMQSRVDALLQENRLLRQELDLMRNRLRSLPARSRPYFAPADRLSILRMAWLNGWSVKEISRRIVIGKAAVWRWLSAWHGRDDPGVLFGRPAWNKLSDAVRDLIQDCRLDFPETEIGTRTIASQIAKAGIALSRATVQRVLRDPPRKAAKAAKKRSDGTGLPAGAKAFHILDPKSANRTWHLDFTVIRCWLFKFYIAALLDGHSRKLLSLRLFGRAPTTEDMLSIMSRAIADFGKPRFVVTDHGGQFQRRFRRSLKRRGIACISGKVRSCKFNGKVERFFRTLKLWQRLAALFIGTRSIQKRLDGFRAWYNTGRCHQAIDGLTPDERWTGTMRAAPKRYLVRDAVRPRFHVIRRNHSSDPNLPVFDIRIAPPLKKCA